jgi:hypothetical protein
MFSLLTLFGFGYLAYREAHPKPDSQDPREDIDPSVDQTPAHAASIPTTA